MPAVVRAVEAPDDAGPADRILSAVDARNPIIPLKQRRFPPIGQEPAACFREARRVMLATIAVPRAPFPPGAAAAAAAPYTTSSHTRNIASPEELLEFLSEDTI